MLLPLAHVYAALPRMRERKPVDCLERGPAPVSVHEFLGARRRDRVQAGALEKRCRARSPRAQGHNCHSGHSSAEEKCTGDMFVPQTPRAASAAEQRVLLWPARPAHS